MGRFSFLPHLGPVIELIFLRYNIDMNTQWALGALAAVILGAVLVLGLMGGSKPNDTVSNAEDMAMRAAIADFGSQLNISVEITSIEQIGEGLVYRVEGYADMSPVVMMLEKPGDKWLVTDWQEDAGQAQPEHVSVVGYWECLPKKGDGPHTMECAFGIAIDQSDGHYGINTSLISTYPVDYSTGSKVRVTGNLMPAPTDTSYDIDGVLWATTIEKL